MRRPRIAVVLAAGKGTRMESDLPKVLHEAAGRPLLSWVLAAAREARCERIVGVIGHGAEQVRTTIGDTDVSWALQREQKGTGHALAQAEEVLDEPAILLVLSGDVPLVTAATLDALAARLEGPDRAWGALAVAELADPGSLGRVLVRPDGSLERIVEFRDASPEVRAVRRVNAGLYALPAPEIFAELRRLTPDNAQGEIYLTDALTGAAARGERLVLHPLDDPDEALGVNNRAELAEVHRRLMEREAEPCVESSDM
jgi:bifunctional UDP-N-acetylglucosamine pyrophosphorylase/glucosamine-1-phosphate N-acetyltransferase